MVIQHNLMAMSADGYLKANTRKQVKSSERLSSGYRINRSADDAAGLSISEKMRRQIRGLDQAAKNSQDGISLTQVADGAMNEVTEMLQRCTELTVKAANGTNSETERSSIQQEINQIVQEINKITNGTTFNDRPVLLGDGGISSVTVTPQGNSLPGWVSFDSASAGSGLMGATWTDAGGTDHAAGYLDFSGLTAGNINDLDGTGFHFTCCTCNNYYSVEFDASTNNSSINSLNSSYTYTIGIKDVVDTAATGASADDLKADLMQTVYNGLQGGHPQNHFTEMAIDKNPDGTVKGMVLYDNRPFTSVQPSGDYGVFAPQTVVTTVQYDKKYDVTLQVGSDYTAGERLKIELPDLKNLRVGSINVMTPSSAASSINLVKEDLNYVSTERSRMGSYQNRLEYTIKNLQNTSENTQAAESGIRDTQMADTMVEHSNGNVLLQAGQAMLAQANQLPQGILGLLQG